MKQKFYLIKDLNVYINLEHLTSFKLEESNNIEKQLKLQPKCCVVVGSSTIYWCDAENFNVLKSLLS